MYGSNVCAAPPTLSYHMYIHELHPTHWEGNLLALKLFLMTQVRACALLQVQSAGIDCTASRLLQVSVCKSRDGLGGACALS